MVCLLENGLAYIYIFFFKGPVQTACQWERIMVTLLYPQTKMLSALDEWHQVLLLTLCQDAHQLMTSESTQLMLGWRSVIDVVCFAWQESLRVNLEQWHAEG